MLELRQEEEARLNMAEVAKTVGFLGLRFHNNDTLHRCELNVVGKVWNIFLSTCLVPSKHMSDVQIDRLRYVYAIIKGHNLNVRGIIRNSFEIMVQFHYAGGVRLVGVITDLCMAYGVPKYDYDCSTHFSRLTGLGQWLPRGSNYNNVEALMTRMIRLTSG